MIPGAPGSNAGLGLRPQSSLACWPGCANALYGVQKWALTAWVRRAVPVSPSLQNVKGPRRAVAAGGAEPVAALGQGPPSRGGAGS